MTAPITSAHDGSWRSRVADDPWLTGWWHRARVAPDAWARYAAARAGALLDGTIANAAGGALVAWRALPWDTEQLGVNAGRVDVALPAVAQSARDMEAATTQLAALLERTRREARDAGVQHLTARLDAQALDRVRAFERAGFELVDGLVTFCRDVAGDDPLPASGPLPAGVRLRETTPEDAERVSAIAHFVHDRFHADPFLDPARADALHRSWVANSVAGRAAEVVFVAEDDQGPLAFTTATRDRLTIDPLGRPVLTIVLVATAERGRRLGLARALARHTMHWARARGVAVVEVGTQLRNVPAARTYVSAGFSPVATSLTLRSFLP
jgi:GNAT superfamily N-acetyltransferase